MKVEMRENSVIISGYVNAVERYSKPIKEPIKGAIRTFVERIKAGVFKNALKRNDNVKVLLNHNHERELANTKNGTAKLEEDSIGLRAEVTITDKEVIEKAKENKLVGWSFGFYANADEFGAEGNNETRTITDLDLVEVSILDDTKSPAYYGTSIEARAENERVLEYRESVEEEGKEDMENVEKEQEDIKEDVTEEERFEKFAELVASIVIERMNGTGEEKTIPNETPVVEENVGTEERDVVDYSEYEKRIASL